MKTKHCHLVNSTSRWFKRLRPWIACGLALSSDLCADGAPFSAGSTGANGDLVVSNDLTLPLPPDGIFHYNSITVEAGRTLTFTRNPLNTPVYLLARSNVTIHGHINVSGKSQLGNYVGGVGGPGGFDGGFGGFVSGTNINLGGAGKGPGGGLRGPPSVAGAGGYRTPSHLGPPFRIGTNYGNPLLIPLMGGSGGGGWDGSRVGGGGGGGAILIASDTVIRIPAGGAVIANGGGGGNGNGGSGGAIRLVSPRVYGAGSLHVAGGDHGGSGYIRIDSMLKAEPNDPSQVLALDFAPGDAATLGGNMVVFPPNLPRLDVVAIGTNAIPFGTNGPAFFMFDVDAPTNQIDVDAPTNQTVTVQARNFNNAAVPIEVALIPESGERTTFPAVVNNSSNPGQVVVPVTVTPNTKVEVQAWIR